uniref:aquaporin-9b isoform X1 n=1 Tax=Scatophagus argus TaxID=75038 RepID=UPI001ED82A34|nr:aquaporin-9b isoform X1 [Scatophagus argus]
MENESKRKMKERFGLRRDIFKEFLAEFLGIFVLILFGCGSVAQTVLSKGALGEPLTIHVGFTLGVMMAVYMAGGVSGAHVNPAVSLAMVILGKLPLRKFPVYVVAQFLGAFAGSCAVYGLYYGGFKCINVTMRTAPSSLKHCLKCFDGIHQRRFCCYWCKCHSQHICILPCKTSLSLKWVIATGALILCILAITDRKNIGAPKGMEPLCIGLIIMAIGVSMGLNCGYPINPARDLGPRFFTAVAGWGMDVFRAGGCWWWIPVAGPMVGGAVGAGIYFLFIELHHPEPEKQEENNIQDKYEIITMS